MSKRVSVALLALLLASSAMALAGGAGTPEGNAGGREVRMIHDVYELQNMSDEPQGSYVLANDVDASATEDWNGGKGFAPVGPVFGGSLDGGGFTISGLFINRPDDRFVGLFAFTDSPGVSVWNLTLASVNITGGEWVGAVAGNSSGDIRDCHVSGAVSGANIVGGLAGQSPTKKITGCSFSGTVRAEYGSVGGIAGSAGGLIHDCLSSGDVSGKDVVGGLIGSNWDGRIEYSYSTANVSGGSQVGGFVGASEGNISRCFSTGEVRGETRVGGFAGYDLTSRNHMGNIYDSYSTGPVWCTMKTGNPGGFVGEANTTGQQPPAPQGGIIQRCYSAGSVDGWPQPGGFIAESGGAKVADCFWDNATSNCSFSAEGTGKSTADMMKRDTFANWDFDTVWKIDGGTSYPYLRDMPVLPGEHAPVITTVPPTDATVGVLYSVQFTAVDPEGDAFSWFLMGAPGWLEMTATGLLSGTPGEGDVGTHLVTVRVTDVTNWTYAMTFELTVSAAVQHEPVWTAVPSNTTLEEGADYRFTAAASDSDAGDTIVYGLTTSPACGLSMDAITGAMEWLNVSAGEYYCALTATDGHSVISHVFMLKVEKKPVGPVNRAPEIVSFSAPEDRTVKASETLNLSADAIDPDGDSLTYEWKDNGVTISTERSFSYKFAPGNHTLILLIGDGRHTTTRTFNFTVARPPQTIDAEPVSAPGFGAGAAAAAVLTVVTMGLFWRRERR